MRTLVVLLIALANCVVLAEETGYQKEVTVREATRLDWVFANSNQSVTNPPAEWLEGYDSTKQRYELFVPAAAKAAASNTKTKVKRKTAEPADAGLALVLFISAEIIQHVEHDADAAWHRRVVSGVVGTREGDSFLLADRLQRSPTGRLISRRDE